MHIANRFAAEATGRADQAAADGSGLDVVRQVKPRYPIKGIALTGYGMEEDLQRSRDAGFALHLTKPVKFQDLVAAIEETVGLHLARRA